MSRKIKRKQKKRANKIGKKMREREQQLEQMENTMKAINASKMVAMLVLRNQGWGGIRLGRFSEKFDEVMMDISAGYLSTGDIPEVLEEETGLKRSEITL